MTFMTFMGLQTFKVKLFFENLMWSNILHHLKTKVNPPTHAFSAVWLDPFRKDVVLHVHTHTYMQKLLEMW